MHRFQKLIFQEDIKIRRNRISFTLKVGKSWKNSILVEGKSIPHQSLLRNLKKRVKRMETIAKDSAFTKENEDFFVL